MKVCGLTGGVGMGKSTAAGFLLQLGAQVVDTDDLARDLVHPGQSALEEIQNAFGAEIISTGGGLNREELARRVFADPVARKKLEEILHPRIRACWQSQVETWRRENCPLAVVVIPLLYETQAEGFFDKIISIACAPASQRERLRSRGWPEAQIQARIAAQMPVEQKIARAHFVIWTEGRLEVHHRQLSEIFPKL